MLVMKKVFNLLFILMIAVVFSPLQSMADCHTTESKKEDCHKCHDDHEQEKNENSENSHGSECAMSCCHMALGDFQEIKICKTEEDSISIIVPFHESGMINNHSEELFRPPIV